jgi:hypothetical protein
MSQFLARKVVAALPAQDDLTPSTLYCVRVGAGFDLYVTTENTPVIARALNPSDISDELIGLIYAGY